MRLKIRLRYLLKNESTIMTTIHFPSKYVPDQLSNADTKNNFKCWLNLRKCIMTKNTIYDKK